MAETPADGPGTVLVLGGYGLIGLACMRALDGAGLRVVGAGRSHGAAAATRFPHWHVLDLARATSEDWTRILHGVDVVVNAAGALQDGASDDLEAIHVRMIERLLPTLGRRRLIQISAAGVSETASTQFFRTKAQGDAVVRSQATDWVILRPTLVLARDAWGGTALLRAAAALPGVLPGVLPLSIVQTVHVDDVAQAVVLAATGTIPSGTVADLTERDARSLPDLTRRMRTWLGLPDARVVPVPSALLNLSARVADALGHLGWRSPLRSTALAALRDGVRGDPAAWEAVGGPPCRNLDATLADIPRHEPIARPRACSWHSPSPS